MRSGVVVPSAAWSGRPGSTAAQSSLSTPGIRSSGEGAAAASGTSSRANGASGEGLVPFANGVPHSEQNFAAATFSAAQLAHVFVSSVAASARENAFRKARITPSGFLRSNWLHRSKAKRKTNCWSAILNCERRTGSILPIDTAGNISKIGTGITGRIASATNRVGDQISSTNSATSTHSSGMVSSSHAQ